MRLAEERITELERCTREREAAFGKLGAAEEKALELQRQLEHNKFEQELLLQKQAEKHKQELERERAAVLRQAVERVTELERCTREREAAMLRQTRAAEEMALELQRQLEDKIQHGQALLLQQQAGKNSIQEELGRERAAVVRQTEMRITVLERCAREREATLLRQVGAAEERALELQKQLERTQQAASVMDIVLRL
jgi:hypothetical protein